MRICILTAVLCILLGCKQRQNENSDLKRISYKHAKEYNLDRKLAVRCIGRLGPDTTITQVDRARESFWVFSYEEEPCSIVTSEGVVTQFAITQRADRPRSKLLHRALEHSVKHGFYPMVLLGDRKLYLRGKLTAEIIAMNFGESIMGFLSKSLRQEDTPSSFVESIDIASDGTLVFSQNNSKGAFIIRPNSEGEPGEAQLSYTDPV